MNEEHQNVNLCHVLKISYISTKDNKNNNSMGFMTHIKENCMTTIAKRSEMGKWKYILF